ncbi:MAG TPA: hypothetical protein VMU01_03005 [Rhizomicrobium sp.]|nr:hypothetical protein [Rhizomicrobium sp.]
MPFAVCLIAAGLAQPSRIASVLERCGIPVWTPSSAGADEGGIYRNAICLVIDMPGDAGVRTLRLLRQYGIKTPALLIADSGYAPGPAELGDAWVLNVIPRTADPREVLRWIECMCVTRGLLDRLHAAEEDCGALVA